MWSFLRTSPSRPWQSRPNIALLLGSITLMAALMAYAPAMRASLLVGALLAAVVASVSRRLKLLTVSGAVATFLMGTVIFGIGQIQWSVPMLAFFVLSSLLSKVGKARKSKLTAVFQKSDTRDAAQVLSNGGVPTAILLFAFFYRHPIWYMLYLSALAAVTADTWGTEIGTLSKREPRSVVTMRKVATGTSGGVTALGITGALTGAVAVGASGLPWLSAVGDFSGVVLAGGLASLVDSLLGAVIQAQYRCPACGKQTEKRVHCENVKTHCVRGFSWFNNDLVNLCCSISGAMFFLVLR